MKMNFRAAFSGLLLAALCVNDRASAQNTSGGGSSGTGGQRNSYVVGGKPAQTGKYPWMVALLLSNQNDSTEAQFCGGTLIKKNLVLTAAHCVLGSDPSYEENYSISPSVVEVMHGSSSLPFTRGSRTAVTGIAIHPKFNGITLENDFALLKLAEDLPGPFMQPALSSELSLTLDGTKGKVVGWGWTNSEFSVLPAALQEAGMRVYSDDQCLNNVGRYFKPDTMLCAANPPSSSNPQGSSSCYGDSGGPLFVELDGGVTKQIGIVSWGFTCNAKEGLRDVFSEVSSGEEFIFAPRTFPPAFISRPAVVGGTSGEAEVGTTLTCSPGTLTGDAADSLYFTWQSYTYTSGTAVVAEGENVNTYVTTPADVDRYVYCSVRATNAGGTVEGISTNDVFVTAAVEQPTPTPTATPEVTPTVEPTPTEVSSGSGNPGPSSSVNSLSCTKSKCQLVVRTASAAAKKASRIEVVLKREIQKSCKARGTKYPCAEVKTELLKATSSKAKDLWKANLARGTTKFDQILRFTIQAVDKTGTVQKKPTTYERKLKKSGR